MKPECKIAKALIFADVVDNLARKVPMQELRGAMLTMDFTELKAKLSSDIVNLQVIADFVHQWPNIKI